MNLHENCSEGGFRCAFKEYRVFRELGWKNNPHNKPFITTIPKFTKIVFYFFVFAGNYWYSKFWIWNKMSNIGPNRDSDWLIWLSLLVFCCHLWFNPFSPWLGQYLKSWPCVYCQSSFFSIFEIIYLPYCYYCYVMFTLIVTFCLDRDVFWRHSLTRTLRYNFMSCHLHSNTSVCSTESMQCSCLSILEVQHTWCRPSR